MHFPDAFKLGWFGNVLLAVPAYPDLDHNTVDLALPAVDF